MPSEVSSSVDAPALYVHRDGRLDRVATFVGQKIVIGRGLDCQVVLDDQTVSTHHATVSQRPDGYVLEDVNSRNNTVLDGVKIRGLGPQPLREGQNFKICEYWFLLQNSRVRVEDGSENSSAIRAAVEVATSSDSDLKPAKLEETLRALLEVGRAVGSTLDIKEILDKTLQALFDIFPQADRGFVYLQELDKVGQELTPTAFLVRRRPPSQNCISRAVVEQVLGRGMALCCEDIANHAALLESESLAGEGIRTMLCAPILDRDRKPIGLLQLDARNARLRFEPKDLELLIAVVGQVAVAVQNARLHQRMLRVVQAEKEMLYAGLVQRALLPEHPPKVADYEFWHRYHPAREVGGDYFGYFTLARSDDNGSRGRPIAIVVGDVAGKGMPAALLMAKLSAEVQIALGLEDEPARILSRLNRRICDIARLDTFITLLLAELDPDSGRLRFGSAGHPPPSVRRSSGKLEVPGEGAIGLPLGVIPDTTYTSAEVFLDPGDLVALYTDGVNEAQNDRYELFGTRRLNETISRSEGGAERVGVSISRAIDDHVQGAEQSDDITILCVGRRA